MKITNRQAITTAPEVYDMGYVRGSKVIGTLRTHRGDEPLRLVDLADDEFRAISQIQRYASGNYVVWEHHNVERAMAFEIEMGKLKLVG